jgi:hypothetical protein
MRKVNKITEISVGAKVKLNNCPDKEWIVLKRILPDSWLEFSNSYAKNDEDSEKVQVENTLFLIEGANFELKKVVDFHSFESIEYEEEVCFEEAIQRVLSGVWKVAVNSNSITLRFDKDENKFRVGSDVQIGPGFSALLSDSINVLKQDWRKHEG